ncbi:protein indeterminate-domain 12-like [Panicum miliaceum]|uniref:Protein EARLY HEADING DATE 2 n=1 Tax=Panicum miliaceum TaxID=4540 RepID=A0A3L6TS72_PANMI|nr:protein indeterminate-domain 12-like [Panicum miliaceum]
MMLSDLSSDHEATGSSSHGGDIASYALSPLFLARAASATAPPQPEAARAAGAKRKRSQPGNPDPGAEVIALSPRTLVATNRFVCEICNKGFQRDQNLQLHRRGHNLPWKLRQRSLPSGAGSRQGDAAATPRKRVYVCPEPTCVHHDPARALGDLTGIKKHFSRKHGEKRWRCERCGKRYAVQSDWKAHVKGCGTREYCCDCGILFTRKDSLLTHRAFCDALAEESARLLAAAASNGSAITTTTNSSNGNGNGSSDLLFSSSFTAPLFLPLPNPPPPAAGAQQNPNAFYFLHQEQQQQLAPFLQPRMVQPSPYLDLHADAAAIATAGGGGIVADTAVSFGLAPDGSVALRGGHRRLTRDFLGVDGGGHQVEELQLPLYATAAAAAVPRAASCATDLTRQCLGERLPPVNETWSHNF